MNVLVVASHPDDEVLGAGGAIIRHVEGGDSVKVLIMTNGGLRIGEPATETLADRHRGLISCCRTMGVTDVQILGFPDLGMDAMPLVDVNKRLEAEAGKPDLVYTHFDGDLNVDHRRTMEAVLTAFRPQLGCSVNEIRSFHVGSSTGWHPGHSFNPNMFVDVTPYIDRIADAFACYVNEVRPEPHPRSIRGLYVHREYWGQLVGLKYAEPFIMLRKII